MSRSPREWVEAEHNPEKTKHTRRKTHCRIEPWVLLDQPMALYEWSGDRHMRLIESHIETGSAESQTASTINAWLFYMSKYSWAEFHSIKLNEGLAQIDYIDYTNTTKYCGSWFRIN
ncbi:hypothetical protein PABG_12282 [Paracoccidioides brasiliensis Pb03]|nr:hypothetical protein PABG_12282 [Paracoccidioides brasiliensis Pb03]